MSEIEEVERFAHETGMPDDYRSILVSLLSQVPPIEALAALLLKLLHDEGAVTTFRKEVIKYLRFLRKKYGRERLLTAARVRRILDEQCALEDNACNN